ncbi:hypothetical protein FO519_000129 [Halicephalobus sp. NKZ332]|nr:hypothetical protein FO519_000129 [Halicephalobus sp. NKZ332]
MATATQGPFLAVSEIAGNILDFGIPSEGQNSFETDSFNFEIADKRKHYEIVHEAMCQVFSYQEPITRAVGASPSEVVRFYHDICEGCFNSPYSILAFDGRRLAGFALSYTKEVKSEPSSKTSKSFKLKKDYAQDISTGPYDNHPSNQLIVFIEEVEKDAENFLPRCKKFFKIDILFVHPNYTGRGLGKKLVERALQMARENNCQYAVTCATAKASAHIFHKFGFTCVREIPFASFRENGSPVYSNLHDGNTSAKLMVLKLGSSISSTGSVDEFKSP